jgi:hypothetical protein
MKNYRYYKLFLKLPFYIFTLLISKIFNIFYKLDFIYDNLSANIDTDRSLNPSIIKNDLIEIRISDIKNVKMKRTLNLRSLFEKWYIYKINRISHDNRTPIYISKNKLKTGDKFYGERISDHVLNSNLKQKNIRRYLKEKKVKRIEELEPEFYVVASLHTDEHEKMQNERKIRYQNKKDKDFDKLVKECIKNGDLIGRTRATYGDWNNLPIIYKVVEKNRIDLVEKLIDSCIDEEELDMMLHQRIDDEGWSRKDGKTLYDYASSEEMKNLLSKYIKLKE